MNNTLNLRALLFALSSVSLSTAAAAAQPLPVEPVALPPAVEQGVDMVYIDPEIAGNIRWRNTKLDDVTFARYAGAPLDLIQAINPLYTDLRRGLVALPERVGKPSAIHDAGSARARRLAARGAGDAPSRTPGSAAREPLRPTAGESGHGLSEGPWSQAGRDRR